MQVQSSVYMSCSFNVSNPNGRLKAHRKSGCWAVMQVVNVTGGRLLQLLAAAEVLQHGGSSQGAPHTTL